MRKLKVLGVLLLLCLMLSLTACNDKKDEDVIAPDKIDNAVADNSDESEPEEDLVEEDNHEGEALSPLTGLYVDEDVVKYRPLAIMMGNTKSAAPQSGIGSASIVYEIPVEGGITRLMSIIEGYKEIDKIGPCRSCRYYFCHFAAEYDALYSHFGQSKYAKDTLARKEVLNINGLKGASGECYYRTKDRKAPHNAYAKGEKIYAFADKNYGVEYPESHIDHFLFADLDTINTLDEGEDALKVTPGYQVDAPYFTYNADDRLYYRFQYKDKHIDQETGEQLTCTNIIIELVSISYFDDKESLKIKTVGSGEGYFVTNGKVVPITWKKDSEFKTTHYYMSDGSEIKLNRGKTWVLLVNEKNKNNIKFN